ncbi:MAG: hypothetical protein ACRC7R_11770 [Sarcina sp.]
MKKSLTILSIILITLFCMGIFLSYKIPSANVKTILLNKAIKKPDVNSIINFLESDKYKFKFKESEISNEKYPTFIGKYDNENLSDTISISGKKDSFILLYYMPIENEKSLNGRSIEVMKHILSLVLSQKENTYGMDCWISKANKNISETDNEEVILGDNIISFQKDINSNSVVLTIERLNYGVLGGDYEKDKFINKVKNY